MKTRLLNTKYLAEGMFEPISGVMKTCFNAIGTRKNQKATRYTEFSLNVIFKIPLFNILMPPYMPGHDA